MFKDLSTINQEVWAVSADGALYRRLGVTAANALGTAWRRIHPGPLIHVSARGNSP